MRAPKPLEKQVQQQIVEGLRALGFLVFETPKAGHKLASGRYSTQATTGLPDLVVRDKHWPASVAVLLEVKRDDKAPFKPEQKELWESGGSARVTSLEDALVAIYHVTEVVSPCFAGGILHQVARANRDRLPKVFHSKADGDE